MKLVGKAIFPGKTFGSVQGFQCFIVALEELEGDRVPFVGPDLKDGVWEGFKKRSGEVIEVVGGFVVSLFMPHVGMAKENSGCCRGVAGCERAEDAGGDSGEEGIG